MGKEPKWRDELFLMVLIKGDSQAGLCNCRPPAPPVTSVKQGAGEVHRPAPPTQCCNAASTHHARDKGERKRPWIN